MFSSASELDESSEVDSSLPSDVDSSSPSDVDSSPSSDVDSDSSCELVVSASFPTVLLSSSSALTRNLGFSSSATKTFATDTLFSYVSSVPFV